MAPLTNPNEAPSPLYLALRIFRGEAWITADPAPLKSKLTPLASGMGLVQ